MTDSATDFTLLSDWQEIGQIAACAILQDSKRRFLLQLRDLNPGTMGGGLWGVFGGRLEPNEDLRTCVAREMAEEIGITIPKTAFTPFARAQSPRGTRLYAYTCAHPITPSDIRLGEGAGFAFFTPDQIAKLDLLPAVQQILHHFFENQAPKT